MESPLKLGFRSTSNSCTEECDIEVAAPRAFCCQKIFGKTKQRVIEQRSFAIESHGAGVKNRFGSHQAS